MKRMIHKHYFFSFYMITLLISFSLFPLHFVFQTVGAYSLSFTQLGPALAVVFISLILRDKQILKEIESRFFFEGKLKRWIIPTLLLPFVCIILTSFLMSLFKMHYVPWNGNLLFYILNSAAMLLGCFAEEVGWRGFLLPRLQEKHSPFLSSIILGLLWGIWHLNFTGGLLGFVLYTITIIEMSILMTWLFNKTNGNLLLMILWHFMFNLTSHIFLWERFTLLLFIVESIVFGIACLYIISSNKKEFFHKNLIVRAEPSKYYI